MEASGELPLGRVFDDWSQRHSRANSPRRWKQFARLFSLPFLGPCGTSCNRDHPAIDGVVYRWVGAYDHLHHIAMMVKLLEIPRLHGPLPRSTYGQPSCYKWTDADGVQHDIHQHEGGEQGDPLLGIVGGCVGHALPQACLDRADLGTVRSRTIRRRLFGAIVWNNQSSGSCWFSWSTNLG